MSNHAPEYTVKRSYDNGRQLSVSISGQMSIDDVVDVFRGMLVQMGYPPEVAARLVLLEADCNPPGALYPTIPE